MFYSGYSQSVKHYKCASTFPEVIMNRQDEEFIFLSKS